jgi:DNA-binding XRE family transcriptional regulator
MCYIGHMSTSPTTIHVHGEDDEPDDLELEIEERTRRNAGYPRILAAAARTRALVKALAQARERAGLTQTEVARLMGTTQPAVARLERGEADPRLSTIERYAEVIGWRVEAVRSA